FLPAFVEAVKSLKAGDPMDESTEIGPLASKKQADLLHQQVEESLARGAELLTGGEQHGAFHQPTVLTDVKPGMPAFEEETFGPLAAVSRAGDIDGAIELASRSVYGLGVTVCTSDIEKARAKTGQIADGTYFINELVKSDPRLPFGGTRRSGYGRELSREGILEFVNKKTVYVKESPGP
ncbi:MAG: aldehyde dehydrogenase family protein, partial [Balneolaceae bacterium]